MDPFSITVGVVGLLDVCSRFILYIRDAEKTSRFVDKDLEAIVSDVKAVSEATELLKQIFETRFDKSRSSSLSRENLSFRVWENIAQILPKCKDSVSGLLRLVEEIHQVHGPKALNSFIKQLKKQAREETYLSLRQMLNNYVTTLQMLLSAIQMSV